MTTPKIIFAPGCFDSLDVSQEELDKLVRSIEDMIAEGTLFDNATIIEEDDPMYERIQQMIEEKQNKKLN
jgi:hypothetical protein